MAAAADLEDKWVIGVDSDQAGDSETVLTSAVKGVDQAAFDALELFYADDFPGGVIWNLGAKEDGVSLPMETSRFATFSQTDYEAILTKVVDGTIVVPATVGELATYVAALNGDYEVTQALKDKIVPPAE